MMYYKRCLHHMSQSSGSNVIPRRARPGLASPRLHSHRGRRRTVGGHGVAVRGWGGGVQGRHQSATAASIQDETRNAAPSHCGIRGANNYITETCNGSEAGLYLSLIDFVHHSTLGLRVIKQKIEGEGAGFKVQRRDCR